jgi:hypothetical protein
MRKILKNSWFLWIILLVLCSCRKEAEFTSPTAYNNTPQGNFDAFWNGIDQNYVFFKYDKINWDSIYSYYRPQINSQTSKRKLFLICVEIMNQMIDGHRELTSNDSELGDYALFNDDYVNKFPYTFEIENVIAKLDTGGFLSTIQGELPSGNNTSVQYLLSIIKNKPIFYVYMAYFGKGLQETTNKAYFDELINQVNQSNYNSMIIDLRSNGGGFATEFNTFVSYFISSNYTWGYSEMRLGRDRYTMSPKIPQQIVPNNVRFNKKVVVLVDRYSFSAAELTALAMKNLPNVTVIGQQTGGANGPVSTEKEFTGNFSMPNGWQIQLAQRVTLDKNQQIFEGKGVVPDIIVPFNQSNFNAGRDDILEKAIEHLSQ